MSLLARLKAETGELHKEIERHVPLMSPLCTEGAYREYLEKLYGFYRPLEAHLSASAQENEELGSRMKCAWLEQDLQALGCERLERLKLCERYPQPQSHAELIGVLYVLEGSTLGGQILMRTMSKNLGISEDKMNFLGAYRENTGTMWNRFRSYAEESVSESDHEAAVLAAQNTFRHLCDWLKQSHY